MLNLNLSTLHMCSFRRLYIPHAIRSINNYTRVLYLYQSSSHDFQSIKTQPDHRFESTTTIDQTSGWNV